MNKGFDVSEFGAAIGDYTGNKIAAVATGSLDKTQDTANAAVNGMVAALNQEMQDFIGKGIDSIYESLGINEESLQFAQMVINTVGGAVAKIGSILSIIPDGVTTVPGIKGTMSAMCSSIKEVAWGIYKDMMFQFNRMAVLVMKQMANPTELLCGVIMIAIEQVEQMIDEQVYKYTGYHILEIYNMCVTGFQLIQTLKQLSAPNAGYDMDIDVDARTAMKQEVMQRLMAYVDSLSIPLRNAFMILQLKDVAMEIAQTVKRFSTMGTDLLAVKIKSIDDVVNIVASMIGDHPHIITLSDIIGSTINSAAAAAEAITDAANAAKDNLGILTDGLTKEAAIAGVISSVNISASKTYQIQQDKKATEDDKTGTVHYNLELYRNPNKLIKPLTKQFRKIQIDGQQVLPSAEISKFLNTLQSMYDNGPMAAVITITGRVGGLRRSYKFHTVLTKEPPEPEKQKPSAPDQIQIDKDEVMGSISDYINSLIEDMETEDIKDDQPIVFDIVEILLKIIKPLSKVLKTIAHYIENYRINKAKCIEHARGNLHVSLLDVFEKTGLKKLIDDKLNGSDDSNSTPGIDDPNPDSPDISESGTVNLYTVRTYRFALWLSVNLHVVPDNKRTASINAFQTLKIASECAGLINVSPFKKGGCMVLYFDQESIDEDREVIYSGKKRNGPAYKDGTMNGIDQVQKDIYTGDIYITDGRSPETSEIYRCIKRQYDPTQ